MFDKTSESFKEQLINELVVFENTAPDNQGNDLSYYPAGVVKYVTPVDKGEVNFAITSDECALGCDCALVEFKDGEVAIVVTDKTYINASDTELRALVAHELGHLISGHIKDKPLSFPNLYREEVERAYAEGDANIHIYWTTKAIVDGGYLSIELEADLIASKFVELRDVCFMQLNEGFKHKNPTVVLEKYNRLKALNDMLKDTQTPSDGYSFEIVMNNANA